MRKITEEELNQINGGMSVIPKKWREKIKEILDEVFNPPNDGCGG